MLPETVDLMLGRYRAYAGRCAHLRVEIERRERVLDALRAQTLADAAAVSAQQYDGMPHASGTSDPTAQIGGRFADGYAPPEVADAEREIAALRAELADKYATVAFVEAWLRGLTEKESWVIEQQIIDCVCWRQVVIGHRLRFGEDYTKDGLKRIKAQALEKIYKMAR